MRKFISYYRVSTQKQGILGLGLEAQRTDVNRFISKGGEFAKLDRLSRNASFIFTLRDAKVDFQCCDLPNANTVTIGIMAVLAQDERERISHRTKSALAELKRQGKKLGTSKNLTDKAREVSLEVRKQNAIQNENNRKAGALIVSFRQSGKSFYQITKEINDLGFKTRTNKRFQQNQVQILFNRYQICQG